MCEAPESSIVLLVVAVKADFLFAICGGVTIRDKKAKKRNIAASQFTLCEGAGSSCAISVFSGGSILGPKIAKNMSVLMSTFMVVRNSDKAIGQVLRVRSLHMCDTCGTSS